MRASIFYIFLSTATLATLIACGGDDDVVPPDDGGIMVDGGGDPDSGPMTGCTGRPTESPEPRGENVGIFDAAKNRIVTFGGNTTAPVMCAPRYTMTNEMWAFHLDCNNWERISPTGGPSVRGRAAAAFDSMRNRMIIYGGLAGDPFTGAPRLADAWAFDLATDTWEELATSGTAPAARSEPAIGYDPANDRLIVSGGDAGGLNGTDDLFALDLATNTWTELDGSSGPSPRYDQGYVVQEGRLYIVGGAEDGGFDGTVDYFNDVWAFEFATDTWSELVAHGAAGAPNGRFGWSTYVDDTLGRIVVFGGHDPTDLGNSNDVWAFDLGAGSWVNMRPGDTLNGTPLAMCNFPVDFTLPEEGSPERRYSCVATQNGTLGYALFGKTDCGNINDVWALDLGAGSWELLRPPTGGEACNRSGSTTCSMLCF